MGIDKVGDADPVIDGLVGGSNAVDHGDYDDDDDGGASDGTGGLGEGCISERPLDADVMGRRRREVGIAVGIFIGTAAAVGDDSFAPGSFLDDEDYDGGASDDGIKA